MFQILDIAKSFVKECIREDGVVCDFTMGNGHDTEYLCSRVPKGKVYAFDIQQRALENTSKLLSDKGYSNAILIKDSHANCLEYVKEKIDAGLFNLGFLPGGDHSLHTMRSSTLPAVKNAISLLRAGGTVVINVYPGHEEGALEGQMLTEYLSTLDKKLFCVSHFHLLNSPDAPFIIAIEKYDKPENY